MKNPVRAVRAALLYTKAGKHLDVGDYEAARAALHRAESILGEDLNRRSLFEFHLRSASVCRKLSHSREAIEYVRRAAQAIAQYRKLKVPDRNYLLDYCDIFVKELTEDQGAVSYRLHKTQYETVTARYLREYPLRWQE